VEHQGIERRLAALLSADVVGYGRLMAADDVGTIETLTAYRGEMTRLIQQNRGRVVDSPGDNLLAEFPSALEATGCAVEIQTVLLNLMVDVPAERRMQFRIGVHLGDVMVQGDRIYGEGVNLAARLESVAPPGGICISASVYEQVRRKLRLAYEDLGLRALKNVPERVHLYRISLGKVAGSGRPEGPLAQEAETLGLSGRPDVAVLVVPAIWVFYVAIVFEILFMISPFALYYYSTYGPSLSVLHRSPYTAWLTNFFLPHFSETSNVVLNYLKHAGFALVCLGGVIFSVGFVQIYGAKLRRPGAVTGGLYALSRHPQYLGLSIVGLGTLMIWPRFLILVTYVTMLFLYGIMSRWEEQRCLQKFGDSYGSYLQRGKRRWHRKLFGWFPRLLSVRGVSGFVMGLVLYVLFVSASVALGYGLREFSLSRVSAFYTENVAVLSPAVLNDEELRRAYQVASENRQVRRLVSDAGTDAKLIVYVVPLQWKIADLPMDRPSPDDSGHEVPSDFDHRFYKVLFTRARTHYPDSVGRGIVEHAYGRDPITLAKVNTWSRQVTEIVEPPPSVRWGDIPTPLF